MKLEERPTRAWWKRRADQAKSFSHENFRKYVEAAARQCGATQKHELEDEQPVTTAFSHFLCEEIAASIFRERFVGYSAAHSKRTKALLNPKRRLRQMHGTDWTERSEWLVDLLLCPKFVSRNCKVEDCWRAVLACESEAWPSHLVDGDWSSDRSGYLDDFNKLLHFRAPVLAFVCRTKVGKRDGNGEHRLDRLQRSLTEYAKWAGGLWHESVLLLCILPDKVSISETRLGLGVLGGSLSFEPLELDR
ncbi:MAG: hypothetical protein ACKVS9_05690 [Phycisphaerae bacterium]